jgi:hypothetical protein
MSGTLVKVFGAQKQAEVNQNDPVFDSDAEASIEIKVSSSLLFHVGKESILVVFPNLVLLWSHNVLNFL